MSETEGRETTYYIYIGPNRTQYGLIQYRVYCDGKPYQKVEELKAMFPKIDLLFVRTDKMMEAENKVHTKGTPQNLAYEEVIGGDK